MINYEDMSDAEFLRLIAQDEPQLVAEKLLEIADCIDLEVKAYAYSPSEVRHGLEDIVTTIEGCARCKGTHENIHQRKLARPSGRHTHYAICPTTDEPIMVIVHESAVPNDFEMAVHLVRAIEAKVVANPPKGINELVDEVTYVVGEFASTIDSKTSGKPGEA